MSHFRLRTKDRSGNISITIGDQAYVIAEASAAVVEGGAILSLMEMSDATSVSEKESSMSSNEIEIDRSLPVGLEIDNPKMVQAQKEGKHPFEYIPLRTLAGTARVLQHGADKYGIRNWRKDPIKASTYKGAFLRHLEAYYEGETTDPDSGESHLSHIMANCMVMIDAALEGTLIDDRLVTESKKV